MAFRGEVEQKDDHSDGVVACLDWGGGTNGFRPHSWRIKFVCGTLDSYAKCPLALHDLIDRLETVD